MLAALLLALLPGRVQAQEQNRAALIVVHGDGRVVQQCVAFEEESISGYELLRRSAGELSAEAGAMGATVCAIDGEGCSYPAESCFCQCQGSPCVYWSYWRMQHGGDWRYQPLGSGNTQVRNGDVEGWHWAAGTRQSASEPPHVRFDDICAPSAQQNTTGEEQAAVPAGSQTQPATAGSAVNSAVSSAVSAATSALVTEAAGAGASGTTWEQAAAVGEDELPPQELGRLWLVLAAAAILPAAVLLIWALLRRER